MSMRDVSGGAATERVVALPLSDLPAGASTSLKAFGTMVAVFNVAAGRLFAVGNNWPHHGGPLCHGRVSGTHLPFRPHAYRHGREGRGLACPWRSWEFDIQSG